MTKATIIGGVFATVFIVLGTAVEHRAPDRATSAAAASSSVTAPSPVSAAHQGLLYGRVTATNGDVYEGRLRFGGDEEALWGNYFNGVKDGNPWVEDAPREQLPKERHALELFGKVLFAVEQPFDLGRPFMARFGDIARLEARGRDLTVTLKSGTVVHLDRYGADDFADGVRVWDGVRGVVTLGERQVRSIEFLSADASGAGPEPLHGTVRTRHGEFTGLVQWDRKACLGEDQLRGHSATGDVSLRFDAIRSIARRSGKGALVTLLDGREIVLSDTRRDGRDNRGMYVDDPRYGRVLISWDAFERVDFSPGGTGPAYNDFRVGHPLTGTVVTRSGERLTGRLVYDLDESETTETLDAPFQGIDYTIPFALIASIEPAAQPGAARARVILHSGEALQLEQAGDLAERNAGMLIFAGGRERPAYVPWTDVARIDIDPPPALALSDAPSR